MRALLLAAAAVMLAGCFDAEREHAAWLHHQKAMHHGQFVKGIYLGPSDVHQAAPAHADVALRMAEMNF